MAERSETFPPEVTSPRRARQLVAAELSTVPRADGDTAVLLTSELATNAARHAGTAFTVSVSVSDSHLRVAVFDGSSDWPDPPVMPPAGQRSGRGLALVAAHAASWGVDPAPGGKVVWFELELQPPGG